LINAKTVGISSRQFFKNILKYDVQLSYFYGIINGSGGELRNASEPAV
jgi:hypothetical protein